MSPRTTLVPGEILETDLPGGGLAYVEYVGHHPDYGDAVISWNRTFARRPTSFTTLETDPGYIVFYPAKMAVRDGILRRTGTANKRAVKESWTVRRRLRDAYGRPRGWVIQDASGERPTALSEDERRLPIVELINHAELVHRILSGWLPDQTAGPDTETTSGSVGPGVEPHTRHYVYFSDEGAAREGEVRLRTVADATELQKSDEDWLVMVVVRGDQNSRAAAERIERVAKELGGEYDGWEVSLS